MQGVVFDRNGTRMRSQLTQRAAAFRQPLGSVVGNTGGVFVLVWGLLPCASGIPRTDD